MNKFIISKATIYDEEQELWYTQIGKEGLNMPLLYTAWGKTEGQSRENAEKLVELLPINQYVN